MKKRLLLSFLFGFICFSNNKAQVSYGGAATYGLRKIVTTYTNSAINVLRACDNATANIGFTTCGDLDTTTLKNFVLVPNPLSAIAPISQAAAYSLRKLLCTATKAIQVRRSCDNVTKDIGFTSLGDLDTVTLKTFVMASNPLSAISAGAGAAFSLRKLRCAYVGSAIQVRRSSDNATSNIGFTTMGDLDTTTLKTFVGAGNGFVRIWYDQSGNGNNAVQATNGNQPQIVMAGSINRQGTQPAIKFSAALTSYLVMPYAVGSLNFSSASTTNGVFAKTGVPTGDAAVFDQVYTPNNISVALAWNNGTGAYAPLSLGHFPSSSWQFAAMSTDVATNINNIITGTIRSGAANTTSINIFQNGTLAANAGNLITVGAIAAQPFNIGKRWDVADYAPMNMQELIVFTSVISTTDRQYLEWGQSQYYGISGPVLSSTLPAGAPSAYVTTWYDQSSNGINVAPPASSNQPRIINTGIIDSKNGRPTLVFDGIDDYFTTNSFPTAGYTGFSANLLASWVTIGTTVANIQALIDNDHNCTKGFIVQDRPDLVNKPVTSGVPNGASCNTVNDNITTGNGALRILSYVNNTTNESAFRDGTSIGSAAYAGGYFIGTRFMIGAWYNGSAVTRYTTGRISEVTIFKSALSNTDRQYIEWSQSQYYSVTGPVFANLPASAPSASIAMWYDQSGNGINLQATGSRQPLIVNAGSIVRFGLSGTWPTIQGTNASQTNLTATFVTAYTGAVLTSNSVLRSDINSTANLRVVSTGNTALTSNDWNNVNYFNINQRNTNQFVIERSGVNPSTSFVVGSPMVLSARFDGTNRQLFNNGTGSGTTADASVFNFNSLRLLQSVNPGWETGEALTGKMSEFGLYYASLSTTRRTLIETNQSAYYNIAISNNKYTPPTTTSYNRYVLGIGRETATDSVGATRASVGMGFTVSTAAGDFLKDNGDYMTAGINCPITASTNVTFLPAPVLLRWDNDWYVNKTDVSSNGGTMSFYFDFGDYNIGTSPGVAANYSLLARGSTASNFSVVPSAIASVVGDRVYFALDASAVANTGYYTIGSTNPPVSPLPIELISFDAIVCDQDVCIDWSTANELNNDYFSIERSTDTQSWSEIKRVKGAGNSQRTLKYSAMDYEPLPGISYYRLKQVDNDKNFKYSKIDAVEFKNDLAVGIYPNPSTGQINISNCKNYNKLYVADLLGRIVFSSEVSRESMALDLNSLPGGEYFVTLTNSDSKKKYTSKLIIDKK